MPSAGIAPQRKVCQGRNVLLPLPRLASYSALLLFVLSGCQDEAEPPTPTRNQQPFVASRLVTVPGQTGQPLASFVFNHTTKVSAAGQATASLDVQVQNESGCTLSFPYTITLSARTTSGQLVHQELSGEVTQLPVNTTVPVYTAIATSPALQPLASIVITPHGQPASTDCPNLVGSWTGHYTIPPSARGYWEDAENGAFSLTVPSAGVVEIRAVRHADIGQVPGLSMRLVGTLTSANEFIGQGLTRVDNVVTDTIQAAGLLKLSSPDPRTGQPRLSVGLRVSGAKNSADGQALQALVTRP